VEEARDTVEGTVEQVDERRPWTVLDTPLRMVEGVWRGSRFGIIDPGLWRAVRAYGDDYAGYVEGHRLGQIAQHQAGWHGWTWKREEPLGDLSYSVDLAGRVVSTDIFPLQENRGGRSTAYAAVWTINAIQHLASRRDGQLTIMDKFILDQSAALVFACLSLKAGHGNLPETLSEEEAAACAMGIVTIATATLDLLHKAGLVQPL
jgi:hypothetical protein